MKKLKFVKICPSGNPTILLDAAQVPEAEQPQVAAALMNPLHLYSEQVGFVDFSAAPRLKMMGGEFCLNASRAMVYEMLRRRRFFALAEIDDLFGLAYCSGIKVPLQVRAKFGKTAGKDEPVECFVTVMAEISPDTIKNLDDGAVLVRVPGISHLLLDEEKYPRPQDPVNAAKECLQKYDLLNEPACGVVWHKTLPNQPMLTPPPGRFITCSITPVVHVAGTGSYVQETACGSATLALALTKAQNGELIFMSVLQPSGQALRVRMESPAFGSRLCKVEVGGWVSVTASGETWVEAK